MLNKKILITGGKNILITGGAGYIGSHLANYFYKKKIIFLLLTILVEANEID